LALGKRSNDGCGREELDLDRRASFRNIQQQTGAMVAVCA
jgi:hypothetical protein